MQGGNHELNAPFVERLLKSSQLPLQGAADVAGAMPTQPVTRQPTRPRSHMA